ncbi:LacI family transcriptional regulator [Cellulomonas hominis]|uniref:LacI family DNA-binding transcriptional regulator n=1 Tax=Cellulomonas hominis TaxID=156981 RepID=UPI001443FC70|nr:LacI family DNA-binding transcriptional regulator [Cellulomonas hominis]MBU5423647.1 LacI family transcriptional regulator [Cellulomonas hominis]NKY09336.1 LacI family transcriptional regulator [Cellulomonas hominis]
MRVTLRDVAARAGVSFKTVSNVINGHPHVTEATRGRVQDAIDALGYRPNQSARSLRHGRSGILALAVPELTSPYFAALASEAGRAAKEHGRVLVIEETLGDVEGERVALVDLTSRLVDGVILSPLVTPQEVVVERIGETPLVMLGEHRYAVRADHVGMDSVRAARELTEHLLATGRRRIAVVGRQDGGSTGGERWLGHVQALLAADLVPDSSLVARVKAYRRADGERAVRELLAAGARPDAVLCFNDLLALGAMHALRQAGLAVPGDVAVAGFDDIEESRYAGLTTVAPDLPLLAREAVRLLVRRVENRTVPPALVEVPFRVEVRSSTA